MQGMPRLIDDKRRKRRYVACALIMIAVVGCCAVSLCVSGVNERRCRDGLAVLRDLKGCRAWLNDAMDLSKDATDLASCLEAASGQFKEVCAVDLEYVNFIHSTRKPECRSEADAMAQQCSETITQLAELRKKFSDQRASSADSIKRIKEQAESAAAEGIKEFRDELANKCTALESACRQKSVSSRLLKECRDHVEQFAKKRKDDSDWQKIDKVHASFVNETNVLTRMMAQYRDKTNNVNRLCRSLEKLPLDSARTIDLTKQKIGEALNKVDSSLSSGKKMRQNASTRIDEALSKMLSNAETMMKNVARLQELHGGFVDAQLRGEAHDRHDLLKRQRQSLSEEVNSRCGEIGERMDRVSASRPELLDGRDSLNGIEDSDDERVFRTCMELLSKVQEQGRKCNVLEKSIAELAARIKAAQDEAQGNLEALASAVRRMEEKLPNWEDERGRLIEEFAWLGRRVMEIRNKVYDDKKYFVNFRDKRVSGAVSSLRQRADKLLESLKDIESGSVAEFCCSNGVELTKQNQRLKKLKADLKDVEQKQEGLEEDMRRKIRDGELYTVTYSVSVESFAAKLHRGERHFDLAVGIPAAGRHLVEICFKKGKRALCATKPARHKVVMHCGITGVHRLDAELSWDDDGDIWQDRVAVEGDFAEGWNDVNLDLWFTVEGGNGDGKSFSSMKWQYQYDSGWFRTVMEDNFWIEVFVDGVPKDILWGSPGRVFFGGRLND